MVWSNVRNRWIVYRKGKSCIIKCTIQYFPCKFFHRSMILLQMYFLISWKSGNFFLLWYFLIQFVNQSWRKKKLEFLLTIMTKYWIFHQGSPKQVVIIFIWSLKKKKLLILLRGGKEIVNFVIRLYRKSQILINYRGKNIAKMVEKSNRFCY